MGPGLARELLSTHRDDATAPATLMIGAIEQENLAPSKGGA
jgi:hypothetical protein